MSSASDSSWDMRRPIELGELVAERYHLTELLGTGGMGSVYRARDLERDREVALKLLHGEEAADGESLARFEREAQMVARVDSGGGVVRVYGLGNHRGVPYFSMELVEGQTLEALFASAPPAPKRLAAILEEVARTLHRCHEAGVVHRDLKPANLLVRAEDGRPLVADFGLARGADVQRLTRTGAFLGTPEYMAPEQALDAARATEPAVDVYQLGGILYRGLTGRPPFQASTLTALMLAVAEEAPERPSRIDAQVPTDLETICLRALAKDPAERYPSAQALADDLDRFQRGEPLGSRPSVSAAVVLRKRLERRDPLVFGLLAALVLVLAGVAVGTWLAINAPSRQARATLEASARFDAEVVRPHALGLGEGRAPDQALVAATRERLRAARLNLEPTERADADALLARLDAAHAVLTDGRSAGRGPWATVVEALRLRAKGDPARALQKLETVSEEAFAPLAALRREVATDLAGSVLAGAPQRSAGELARDLAEVERSLEPGDLAPVQRAVLEAKAEEWAKAARAARGVDDVRAFFARLRLAAGKETSERLLRLLDDVLVDALPRPGEGLSGRTRTRLFAFAAQMRGFSAARARPQAFVEFLKTHGIRSSNDPLVLVAILSEPVIEIERGRVMRTIPVQVVEEQLKHRPWSRALRYVLAAHLVEKTTGAHADPTIRAEAVVDALREVVRPSDALIDDLLPIYWYRVYEDLARYLLRLGTSARAGKDAPVWDEARAALRCCRELAVGTQVRQLVDVAEVHGRLEENLRGWRAGVEARRSYAEAMEAELARMNAAGRPLHEKPYEALVRTYARASRCAYEQRSDPEAVALALELAERGLVHVGHAYKETTRYSLRFHLARIYYDQERYQDALDVLEPELPDMLVQEHVAFHLTRVLRKLGQKERLREVLRMALERHPNSERLKKLRDRY